VAEKVLALEAAVNELQTRIEQQRRALAKPSATTGAEAAAVLPTTAQPRSAATTPPPTASGQIGEWWFEMLVFLGLTGIAVWLFRLHADRNTAGHVIRDAVVAAPAATIGRGTDPRWHLQKLNQGEGSVLGGDSVAAMSRLPAGGDVAAVNSEDDEVTSVLELAEIMTSFGRTAGAAQVLKEFVDQKPAAAVAPWIKLLEVHRRSDERDAFEIAGMKLKHHFNVAPPDWEGAEQLLAAPAMPLARQDNVSAEQLLARLPSIRQLPHIAAELARTWDTPECPAYLHRLLRDNRGGERRGFHLATVRELQFVIDLQESRLARRL